MVLDIFDSFFINCDMGPSYKHHASVVLCHGATPYVSVEKSGKVNIKTHPPSKDLRFCYLTMYEVKNIK